MSDTATPPPIVGMLAGYNVLPAWPMVNFVGLHDKLIQFLKAAGNAHQLLFDCELIVTSAVDSIHVESSKHGKGEAVDLRTHDLAAVNQDRFLAVVNVLADRFGLTVFDERNLPNGPHFHVEVAG